LCDEFDWRASWCVLKDEEVSRANSSGRAECAWGDHPLTEAGAGALGPSIRPYLESYLGDSGRAPDCVGRGGGIPSLSGSGLEL
jgi:hypothetical protein